MKSTIQLGKDVLRIEMEAVALLLDRVGPDFERAVDVIHACDGRVVVTGMGKSGIIARKLVATLNSTGTPSIFLHASDAAHGDVGTVRKGDVVICISKSGDTSELTDLLSLFRTIQVPIISIVGNVQSGLAKSSDIVLDASVKEEACPYDLAPTASTTAALAFCDALSMAVLDRRNFTAEQFAMFHPGGNIGKRLLLKIEELMVKGEAIPKVCHDVPLKDAIFEMTSKRLGATTVVSSSGELLGIITDGDLRRLLQTSTDVSPFNAGMAMTKNPKTIRKDMLASGALALMEDFKITQLVIVDEHNRPEGIIHLHELVKAGFGSGTT